LKKKKKKVVRVLWRGKPINNLIKSLISKNGRNNKGRITVRHLGSGVKNCYRLIDYSRTLMGIPAIVLRIEKDPNRNVLIALICYFNGILSYVIAPKILDEFKYIITSFSFRKTKKEGDALPLALVSSGQFVYNIENHPFVGSQYARSGGSYAQVIGNIGGFSVIKLNSGVVRLFYRNSIATFGVTSSIFPSLKNAGLNRLLGRRPSVRGVAMNPIDHPHGGGQGKTSGGRPSVSPWARYTKGGRTRKKVKKWWILRDPTYLKKKERKI